MLTGDSFDSVFTKAAVCWLWGQGMRPPHTQDLQWKQRQPVLSLPPSPGWKWWKAGGRLAKRVGASPAGLKPPGTLRPWVSAPSRPESTNNLLSDNCPLLPRRSHLPCVILAAGQKGGAAWEQEKVTVRQQRAGRQPLLAQVPWSRPEFEREAKSHSEFGITKKDWIFVIAELRLYL